MKEGEKEAIAPRVICDLWSEMTGACERERSTNLYTFFPFQRDNDSPIFDWEIQLNGFVSLLIGVKELLWRIGQKSPPAPSEV